MTTLERRAKAVIRWVYEEREASRLWTVAKNCMQAAGATTKATLDRWGRAEARANRADSELMGAVCLLETALDPLNREYFAERDAAAVARRKKRKGGAP